MMLYSRKGIRLLSILIFLGLIFSPVFLPLQEIWADTASTSVTITVTGQVCGNNVREGNEECDGNDLGDQTCVGLGYVSGNLSCYVVDTPNQCTFDTSGCTVGGGGGGGGVYIPRVTTKVIIKGMAYPLSHITILKDGRVETTTIADSQANFNVEITNITAGIWTFGIYAKDDEGRKSITFSFTTNVISRMTTTISGIFLPPTIDLSKTILERGETLNILGQTAPQSDIIIFISSDEIIKKTIAQADGTWFYGFDTTLLEEGFHATRAQATSSDDLLSTFSNTLAFYVGKEIPRVPGAVCSRADLNGDGKTNLIDFSILIYWWGRYDSCADQNGDGKVNLVDLSIMVYWWTG